MLEAEGHCKDPVVVWPGSKKWEVELREFYNAGIQYIFKI